MTIVRLATLALLLAGLAACTDWNWREAGRGALEATCRSADNCNRSCDSPGAKAMGNCSVTPEAH
jgi:hypothetical protein